MGLAATLRKILNVLSGGIWYYTEHIRENQGAAAYEDLTALDTKDLMAFSDYPMPERYSQV